MNGNRNRVFKAAGVVDLVAYSDEADHDSGLMSIITPGHAEQHRSEVMLDCFMMWK